MGRYHVNPNTIYTDKVTIAATAAPLAASTSIRSVTIAAASANAGDVYVGDSTVAAGTGYALVAGATISMDIDNLASVYVIGTVADVVTYIAVA